MCDTQWLKYQNSTGIISTGLCPLQRRLENMAINTKQINIIQNTEKGIIGNNSIIHTYMMWVDMP